jgi:polysaccharide export outer membrane protein
MSALTEATLKLCLSITIAASVGLFAQEQSPPRQEPQQQEQQTPEAKPGAPDPSAAPVVPVDPKTFKLGSEDVIEVRVWRENDLTGLHSIRPDGKISMPLIREVQAAGLTPEELSKSITEKLTKFINNPQVFVSVRQVRSQRYYVTGEVNRPGAYPLVVPTTVFEAITLAGGFREWAKKKDITISRGDKRLKFNYNDIVKGKKLDQNIKLQDGDHVIVP